MSKIIAISNQKGGVGKTTTAINLAADLAILGRKVLLVDLDPQGNASSGLGFDKNHSPQSIYDVMINHIPPFDILTPTDVNGLSLLPAGIALAGAEVEMVNLPEREHILKKALAPITDAFDYILIDCPPSLGLLTLNALTAAHAVLVPIQCEFFALEGLGQLMNTIKLVKKHLNPSLSIDGVVCTMFDGRTNLSTQVMEDVKKFFSAKVYGISIPRNVRIAEAPSFGKPIELYDHSCTGAESYRALSKEMIKRNEGVEL